MLAIIVSNGENALRARLLYRVFFALSLLMMIHQKLLSWKTKSLKSVAKIYRVLVLLYVCIGGFYITTNKNDTLDGF